MTWRNTDSKMALAAYKNLLRAANDAFLGMAGYLPMGARDDERL